MPVTMINRPAPANALGTFASELGPAIAEAYRIHQEGEAAKDAAQTAPIVQTEQQQQIQNPQMQAPTLESALFGGGTFSNLGNNTGQMTGQFNTGLDLTGGGIAGVVGNNFQLPNQYNNPNAAFNTSFLVPRRR